MSDKTKDNKKCLHCSTFIGNSRDDYCCFGCKTAHSIIANLGLNNFYTFLEFHISREALKQNNNDEIKEVDMSGFVIKEDDGSNTLNLLIEGIHCSSCVWLIEEALKKQDNILYARLNMSTRRLVVKWRGDEKLGNNYTNLIIKMGYKATAFNPETMQTEDNKEQRSILLALAVAAFASGNIMLMSVALWSSTQQVMGIATRDFIHLISAIIALPTVLFSGRIFFKSAIIALRNKRTNMDVPISIAIILTTVVSVIEWLDSAEHTYFDSVTMLIFFLLIGRYLDIRTKNKARSTASALLSMMNNSAILVNEDGSLKTVPANKIVIGDIIQVNTGDKIAVDGVIISGETQIDTSIITGESLPKEALKGDEVFSGTINLGQTIQIKVTKPSDKSLIAEVIKLIEKAEDNTTKYNSIAEKAIKIYSPLVYFAGLITFVFWFVFMEYNAKDALVTAISVLIITCPCAFGLAVPTVQVLASSALFKRGIMLKNGNALELLSKVKYAIFDKTGTLTFGQPKLTNKDNINKDNLILAASISKNSNHPYSKAIFNAVSVNSGFVPLNISTREVAACGLEAEYQGNVYRLGKAIWALNDSAINKEFNGVILTKNGELIENFQFLDDVREDASNCVKELARMNIHSKLISGDNNKEVLRVAQLVGIKDYFGEALPADKVSLIQRIKDNLKDIANEHILMVGDGLNDAPAFAYADVSISPSSAIDITQNSADIVFQGDKLAPIVHSIKIAKKAISVIKQNFSIAMIYNLIAIPYAFMGNVTPLVAALAMSFSSILVLMNSFRVRV